MPFQIIRNDITKVAADVIVNTANPHPVIGNGTDSAIYAAAGEEVLLAERLKIGEIAPGELAVTPAFGLSAKYIIHTVGPVWIDGEHGEEEILHSCYAKSLAKAEELKAESIAFPLIATGVYGFPRDKALNIALSEIGKFLLTHEMKVILVVFDRESVELSKKLVSEIDEFIDEYGVGLIRDTEYCGGLTTIQQRVSDANRLRRLRELEEREIRIREERHGAAAGPSASPFTELKGRELEDVVGDTGKSFQQRLFELIDESGMDDVTVYSEACIGKKVFSKIRCKEDYKPSKKTAVALSIALKLDMPTMLDLLSRAGIAFSPSNKFDLIIAYFVTHGNYDVFLIDEALYNYGLPTVFSEE